MPELSSEIAQELYDGFIEKTSETNDTAIVLTSGDDELGTHDSFAVIDYSSDSVWIVTVAPGVITEA